MNIFKIQILVCILLLNVFSYGKDSSTFALQNKIYEVFENNKDSVVKIYAQKNATAEIKDTPIKKKVGLEIGSGFLISKEGLVLTSAYITYASTNIWVEWNGLLLDAKCIGYDPLTTLSVLRLKSDLKAQDPKIIEINESAQLPKIGTLLLGISCEMGLPAAPRLGISTGNNIEFGGSFLPTVYIRSDIFSPKGSAGGAVFDMYGNFIGMSIASIPDVSGSFVLPAKAICRIRDDILLCGEPVYSWFGMMTEDIIGGVNEYKVFVKMVVENGPAKEAGFLKGDVIMEINSQKILNNTQLRNVTFFVRPAEVVRFKVMRGNEIVNLELLAKRLDSEVVKSAEKQFYPAKKIAEETLNSEKSADKDE